MPLAKSFEVIIGVRDPKKGEAALTELRANEKRLAFLLQLNDALRPLSDAGAIQEIAARHLCEHLGHACKAGLLDQIVPVLAHGTS